MTDAVIRIVKPKGTMYAFIKLADAFSGKIDDRSYVLDVLESKRVLVAPDSSIDTPYFDRFRITTLPDPNVITDVFARIDTLLEQRA